MRPARAVLVAAAVAGVVTLAGAVPRLAVAAGALPDALRPFIWSDVLYVWERGLSGGRLPYWHTPFEYPPLIGYASAAFSIVSGSGVVFVALWTATQVAAAALVGAALASASSGRRALIGWSLAPQLALFGPVNFDLVAIAAAVVAIVLCRRAAAVPSAVAIAAGTAAKLFPAVLLPIVLLASGARARIAAALAFTGLLAACYAPAALAPHSSLLGIGRYAVGIGANVDSVWGSLGSVLAELGISPGGPILVITMVGLVVTYAFAVIPAARRSDPAVGAGLAVATLLIWTRLYSPQYSLWMLPFLVLTHLPSRWSRALLAADAGVFLSIYPLTLVRWDPADPLQGALVAVLAAGVALRHVALIGIWVALYRSARTVTTVPA